MFLGYLPARIRTDLIVFERFLVLFHAIFASYKYRVTNLDGWCRFLLILYGLKGEMKIERESSNKDFTGSNEAEGVSLGQEIHP